MPQLGVGVFKKETIPEKSYTGLYDQFSDDIGYAMGVDLIDGSCTGPCMRVKRASDDAEMDIYFRGTKVSEGMLKAFCAGTDGVVTRFYSQKDSSVYLETGTGYEPVIVENGEVVRDNSGNIATKWVDKAMAMTYSAGLKDKEYGILIDCSAIDGDTESVLYSHGFNIGTNEGMFHKCTGDNYHRLYWGGANFSTSGIWTDNSDHRFVTFTDDQGEANPSFYSYDGATQLHEIWRGAQPLYDDVVKVGTQWGYVNASSSFYLRNLVYFTRYFDSGERNILRGIA